MRNKKIPIEPNDQEVILALESGGYEVVENDRDVKVLLRELNTKAEAVCRR